MTAVSKTASKLEAVTSSLLKRFDSEPRPTAEQQAAFDRDEAIKQANRNESEKRKEWARFIAARGSRYRDCDFENFKVSDDAQGAAVSKLRSFCDSLGDHRNLVLLGPSGTGKDHLLSSCVREAIRRGEKGFQWTSGPELFSSLRTAISRDQDEASLLRPLLECDVLVISDLAMSVLTDYQREIVYKIVDRRYNNERPIWVSANVPDRKEFEKATSPQIADRIIDGALYVPCNWSSYRKTKP